MLADVRLALRRLRRAPLYCAFAVLTLALGIAVTAATYSALYRAFWRPLGVHHENGLVALRRSGQGAPRHISLPDLIDVRAAQQALESVEASGAFTSSLSGNGRATLVTGEAVTGGYFNALGVRATLGRTLQPMDEQPGAGAAIVLAERTWRSAFSADPDILGKVVKVADRPFEVVGVIDDRFAGVLGLPMPDTSLWVPLTWAGTVSHVYRNLLQDTSRRSYLLQPFGRLAPGRSVDDARFDVARIASALDASNPIVWRSQQGPVTVARDWTVGPLAMRLRDAEAQLTRVILIIPALVFLIACSNLMNLVLSRGSARMHELAVRRALGGTRWRLIRAQLVEVTVIAAAGGVLGLQIARGLLRYVDGMITDTFGYLPRFRLDDALEPAILGAVAAAAIVAVLVAGLAPAVALTSGRRSRLAVDSPGLATPRWRGRSNLIALQVSASVGLFLFASFLIGQLPGVGRAPSGMDLDRTAMVNLAFSAHQRNAEEVRRITDRVLEQLRAVPGVEVASAAAIWGHGWRAVWAHTATASGQMRSDWVRLSSVDGATFRALGLPIVSGRAFDQHDESGPLRVMINVGLAVSTFGTADAAGRSLQFQIHDDTRRSNNRGVQTALVVGVVSDTFDSRGRARPVVYMPIAVRDEPDVEIYARSESLDTKALTLALRTAVMRVDPELAVSFAGPADVLHGAGGARIVRMVTTIALSLAAFALILATAGLYGVLTHVFALRTRELGIRAALGASRRQIRNLVLKEGLRPVVEGGVIGLGAAAVMTLSAQPLFAKQVPAMSAESVLAAVLPLAVAGAVACYLPARRASRLDPSVCLRSE